MSQTVIGFFDDASEVQRAVEQLERKGISRDRIDVSRGGSSATSATGTDTVSHDRSTPDGRTVDAEGRNTNAITDFFNSLFGGKDDDNADRYSHVASRSNSIVTVHARTREEAEAAAEILDDCGAVDVEERAAQYGYGNTRGSEAVGDRQYAAGDRSNTIERMEDNLEAGKQDMETGGLRMRSRIVERPVEERVRLREEHRRIENNPIDRSSTNSNALNTDDDYDDDVRPNRGL